METIKAPVIQYPKNSSKIYTTKEIFNVTIKGRKGTNIYCDGIYVDKMPNSGYFTFQKSIKQKNSQNSYKIRLRYNHTENESVDATLYVIHDNKVPIIKTESIDPINENSLQIKTLLVEDNFDEEGLFFSISGGVDKSLFSILSKKWKITINRLVIFANYKLKYCKMLKTLLN